MPFMYPYLPVVLNQTYPIESFWTPHGVDILLHSHLRLIFLGFWLQFGIIPVEMDQNTFTTNRITPPIPTIQMWLNHTCNHPSLSTSSSSFSYNPTYPLNTITLNVIDKDLFIRALSYLTPQTQEQGATAIPLWSLFNLPHPEVDQQFSNTTAQNDDMNDDDDNGKDTRSNRSVKSDFIHLFLQFDGVIFQLLTLNEYRYNSLNTYNLTCTCIETFSPGLPPEKDTINKFLHYHSWLQKPTTNQPHIWQDSYLEPALFAMFHTNDIQSILTNPQIRSTPQITATPIPLLYQPHFYPQHLPSRLSQLPGMTTWYRECGLVRTQLPSYGVSLHLFPIQLLGIIEYSKQTRGYRIKKFTDGVLSPQIRLFGEDQAADQTLINTGRQTRGTMATATASANTPSSRATATTSPSHSPIQTTSSALSTSITMSPKLTPVLDLIVRQLNTPPGLPISEENEDYTPHIPVKSAMIPITHLLQDSMMKSTTPTNIAQNSNKNYTREYNDIVFDTNNITSIDQADLIRNKHSSTTSSNNNTINTTTTNNNNINNNNATNPANPMTINGTVAVDPDVKISYGVLPPSVADLSHQPQLNAIYRLQRLQANNATVVPPSAKPYVEAMDKTLTTHINTQNTTIQHLVQQNQTVLESIGELAKYTNVLSIQFQQMSNMMLLQQTEFMNGLQKVSNLIDKQDMFLNEREDYQTIQFMQLFDEIEQQQQQQDNNSNHQFTYSSTSMSSPPSSHSSHSIPKLSTKTDYMVQTMKEVLFQRFLQRQQDQADLEREARKRTILYNSDGHHYDDDELDGAFDENVANYAPGLTTKRQKLQCQNVNGTGRQYNTFQHDLSADLINQHVQLSPNQSIGSGYSAAPQPQQLHPHQHQLDVSSPSRAPSTQHSQNDQQHMSKNDIQKAYDQFNYLPNPPQEHLIEPGTIFIEEDL